MSGADDERGAALARAERAEAPPQVWWRAEAEAQMARAEEAEARADALRAALGRLRPHAWHHPNHCGMRCYCGLEDALREVDAALAAADAQGART